jgi:phosphoribosylaminoimidazole-succinocarboxamide synthase
MKLRAPVVETTIPGLPVRRGKVRDIYELGDRLLLVATDRISAFDCVLPTGIPDKGRVLTGLSVFWFRYLNEPNHLLTDKVDQMELPEGSPLDELRGRTMLVRRATPILIECVVRGYLAGSAWKEYQKTGMVCGIPLPKGLVESAELEQPIFTPATKAHTGHDENISFDEMVRRVGAELADELRRRSVQLYASAREYARSRGILLADTKLEWGLVDGQLLLIDEVFTPDSSRFWPADEYRPGRGQPSFDKQFVRDWLEQTSWDKNSPPPPLPDDVVEQTRQRYIEAYERLTGQPFPWK